MGLKGFNQTGRNDTTTEVLRPKTNPALAQRNAILIVIVILAFALSSYFVYTRSGLDLKTILNDPGHSFGAKASESVEDPEKSDKQ
jgi:hypothetical protein